VPLDDDDFQRLLSEASIFRRRREWLALGIGTACALPLSGAILDWASVGRSGWLLALSLPLPGVVGSIREALSWLLKKLLPVP
jgi:hypothetical protein